MKFALLFILATGCGAAEANSISLAYQTDGGNLLVPSTLSTGRAFQFLIHETPFPYVSYYEKAWKEHKGTTYKFFDYRGTTVASVDELGFHGDLLQVIDILLSLLAKQDYAYLPPISTPTNLGTCAHAWAKTASGECLWIKNWKGENEECHVGLNKVADMKLCDPVRAAAFKVKQ